MPRVLPAFTSRGPVWRISHRQVSKPVSSQQVDTASLGLLGCVVDTASLGLLGCVVVPNPQSGLGSVPFQESPGPGSQDAGGSLQCPLILSCRQVVPAPWGR